ncbi:MAG: Na+-dependent transporter [Betaproteobacteria bacterium]
MDLQQLIMLVLQISILATVFTFGLRATTADVLHLVRRPSLLGRSLLAMFVIMPLLAFVLVRGFAFTPGLEIGLLAIAIAPIPPLLPGRVAKAGGQGAYGIALMATIGLLSVVIVPLAVHVLGALFGREIEMPFSTIAMIVFKTIVAPLLAGIVVRAFLPTVADRIVGPIAMIAKVLLAGAVLALLAGSLSAIWAAIGSGNVLALAIFVIIGLAAGHLLGGPDPESRIVLALSTSCRHPAIAFTIASVNFPQQRFGGIVLTYVLLGLILGFPYVMLMRRKAARAAAVV